MVVLGVVGFVGAIVGLFLGWPLLIAVPAALGASWLGERVPAQNDGSGVTP